MAVNSVHFFLQLIRCSLGNQKEFNTIPSEKDWEQIFLLAQEQTLLGVLFAAINNLPPEQKPPTDIYLQWFVLVDKIRNLNDLLNRRTSEAVQTLEQDGFSCVLLKGQGMSLLYPDPMLRIPGDIDLWLLEDRKKVIEYIQQRAPEECPVYHNIPFPLFTDVDMEVHFTPSWSNWLFYNRRLQRFFKDNGPTFLENRSVLPGHHVKVAMPSRFFNAVFILHHIYRHLFGDGVGFRQVFDYYYVIKDGFDEQEKNHLIEIYKELGMYKFATAIMYILNRVFGLHEDLLIVPVNEKEGQYLLDEIMRAGNFGKYDSRIVHRQEETKIESFFRINKQVVRHLFHYPYEVIGSPLYRIWHFCWRKWNGYGIR